MRTCLRVALFCLAIGSAILTLRSVPAQAAELLVGAGTISITPDQPVALDGQFNTRISTGVDNPVTATAAVLETRQDGRVVDQAVLVSCDLVGIRPQVLSGVRERLAKQVPDLDGRKVILTATHTHTAPVTEEGKYEIPKQGVMQPNEYAQFLADRLAELIAKAWKQRSAGGVSWGLGHAVVGYNRRAVYADGHAQMYGKTDVPEFRGLEGSEDHALEMLFLWSPAQQPLAVAVNLACPSQEVESGHRINADFWHDVRRQLQTDELQNLLVLGWPGAAGDQSPHRMFRKAAEERMLKLRGLSATEDIARRITREVRDVLPLVRGEVRTDVILAHHVEELPLPVRRVTDQELAEARAQVAALTEKKDGTRKRAWYQAVVDRYQQQDQATTRTVELHVVRIGDVALVTNPFELFLDYGFQIKGRSPAVQTFILQLTSGTGAGYLPTPKAVDGGGYSAVVQSSKVGPEGGQALVDRSVEVLKTLFAGQRPKGPAEK